MVNRPQARRRRPFAAAVKPSGSTASANSGLVSAGQLLEPTAGGFLQSWALVPYCRLNAMALTEVQNTSPTKGRRLAAIVPEKRSSPLR